MTDKEGIVYSDVDGTIGYLPTYHHFTITQQRLKSPSTVTQDGTPDKEFPAMLIGEGDKQILIHPDTGDLARKLKDEFNQLFVYVTGARQSTMATRLYALNFADYLIVENGGVILNENLKPDQDWEDILRPHLKDLKDVESYLTDKGWTMDNQDRRTSIRVSPKHNLEDQSVEDLFDSLTNLPEGITKTKNVGHLDIIPDVAGKGNAVRFLTEKLGFTQDQTMGMGDDFNDLDMLQYVGKAFVLRHSQPIVLAEAIKRGWVVAARDYFEGTNEILQTMAQILSERES